MPAAAVLAVKSTRLLVVVPAGVIPDQAEMRRAVAEGRRPVAVKVVRGEAATVVPADHIRIPVAALQAV